MQADNGLNQIRLRKYENILAESGRAVIAFGVWSILKAALFFLTQPIDLIKVMNMEKEVEELSAAMADVANVNVKWVVSAMALGFLFTYMAMAVLLRYYIGRSAVTDARRLKKKSIFYILLAVLLGVSLIMALIPYSLLGAQQEVNASDQTLNVVFTSKLLDFTSLVALIEMIFSAIRVRQIRKRLGIIITGKNLRDGTVLLEEKGLED